MNVRKALCLIRHILSSGNIDDVFIEAEALLCHVLDTSKTQLYTEPERTLTPEETSHLKSIIRRRLQHEPTPYISGYCSFYNIDLRVNHHVLIPRPETETLIQEAIDCISPISKENAYTIADIGTGSGAIAISLSLALPQATIYATDISGPALQVAKMNCQRYKLCDKITFLQGNLLEPLPKPVDMIVANLPYVENSELTKLSQEIRDFEPRLALAGGDDGLDIIRQLLLQAPDKLHHQGSLLMEIGQGQAEKISSLVHKYHPQATIKLIPDFRGIYRVVKVQPEGRHSNPSPCFSIN